MELASANAGGGKSISEHQIHELTTIVPHARTLRKSREQIRLMVFDGLSAKRIRNYLQRFVMWWQNTSTSWEYQEILQQFIDVCWNQRVANYAAALLQLHFNKSHTRSLCDLVGAVGAA